MGTKLGSAAVPVFGMKWWFLAVVVFGAIGCAGSGSDSPSPFAGRFTGAWIQPSGFNGPPDDQGAFDIAVDSEGRVTGTFSESTPVRSGALAGNIRRNGSWTFHVNFSGETLSYFSDASLEGNRLAGSFSEVNVGYGGFFPAFDLNRQP